MSDLEDILKEENMRLREHIDRLEREMFSGDLNYPMEWMLTVSEKRVVGLLLARRSVRKDQIMTALYRDQNRDEAEPKVVDVFVCKIRRKLKPFGIAVRTIWGAGYTIDEPLRTTLIKALEPEAGQDESNRLLALIAEGMPA